MKRTLSILIILLLCVSVFVGCEKPESPDNKEPSTTNQQENNPKDDLGPQTGDGDVNGEFILPTLSERIAWNIEIKYLKSDDKGFWITIIDHDNQGFAYNDLYYILECWDGQQWVKLTRMNESNAERDLSYVFPSENSSYIDTNSLNYFSLLPSDVTLENGRYRITKVLSGKSFSVEFDYETND